jgi:hypothetical protein
VLYKAIIQELIMTDNKKTIKQKSWSVFFNHPITKEQVQNIIEGLNYRHIIYKDSKGNYNNIRVNWHIITFDVYEEFNKLRTALLLEKLKVEYKTTELQRNYIDVYIK